jgi:hypothetical protein
VVRSGQGTVDGYLLRQPFGGLARQSLERVSGVRGILPAPKLQHEGYLGMPERIIGRKPRPRALIQLGPFDNVDLEAIEGLPTVQEINGLSEVRQEEWDALITTLPLGGVRSHVYVMGFGCHSTSPDAAFGFGYYEGMPSYATERSNPGHVDWTGVSQSQEFIIPEGLPPAIENMVLTGLLPVVRKRSSHKWLYPVGRLDESDRRSWEETFQAFLCTGDRQAIAGRFLRRGGRAECWCFPEYAIELAPILVKAALGEWAKRDPKIFPLANWVNQSQWRTPAENRAATQLEKLQAKRVALLRRLDTRQQNLEAELAEARRSAEIHERLLLTQQGDRLVSVVAECFSDLGFGVKNMDNEYPAGDRLEDLQLTAPEALDWTALVEVRGYRRGAQLNDLLRFSRFRSRFVARHGREPGAQWYVANQFLEHDPTTRPPILQGNDTELRTFGEDGGVAIDTADLFRLWMTVKDGRLTSEEARLRLIQARERFILEQ